MGRTYTPIGLVPGVGKVFDSPILSPFRDGLTGMRQCIWQEVGFVHGESVMASVQGVIYLEPITCPMNAVWRFPEKGRHRRTGWVMKNYRRIYRIRRSPWCNSGLNMCRRRVLRKVRLTSLHRWRAYGDFKVLPFPVLFIPASLLPSAF